MTEKLCHPWCERNKGPILDVLRRFLPAAGSVLEIGSGSGQHAVYFAKALGSIRWQPSDIDEKNLESIRAWVAEAKLENVSRPLALDVLQKNWAVDAVDAVFCANMIHISPWECCLGLVAGARRVLSPGGLLVLYGPFRIGGQHTAPSNADFDRSLRTRDSRWGVRDLETVCDAARGFVLEERIEMPADNQMLVFRRIATFSSRSTSTWSRARPRLRSSSPQ
jgi:SAM-dependent methyltransferase